MKVIGLAGWSGAGKTTLLKRLLPLLIARGHSVSTLKHAHHSFDMDKPGKDSHEHRLAGASEVLVASGNRWALLHELRGAPEPSITELLAKLGRVDLVLIEGFKRGPHPKIEVYRAGNGKPMLAAEDPDIVAIATDVALPDAKVPIVDLNDVEAIADVVLAHAAPIEAVIGRERSSARREIHGAA